MIPDLGKYAVPVLSAYAGSIVVLVAIVGMSFAKGRRARADLDAVESRRQDGDT